MPKVKPASTVDAPYITKEEARGLPEFAEGIKSREEGKSTLDCPYSLPNQTETQGRLIPSAEWRLQYENRFQAWLYGYNDGDGQ